MKQTMKRRAIQVSVVVENWRLKKAAKGANPENRNSFRKCYLS
jgi:hypothetical protein